MNRQSYIYFIIFGIIGIVLMIFTALFLLNSIKNHSNDLISQKKALIEFNERIKNSKEMKEIYQNRRIDLENIESVFIKKEKPIEFIEFLEQRAEEFLLQIKIHSISFENNETDKREILKLQMGLQGRFSDFFRFLETIENSAYLLEVCELNIKKTDKDLQEISAVLSVNVCIR